MKCRNSLSTQSQMNITHTKCWHICLKLINRIEELLPASEYHLLSQYFQLCEGQGWALRAMDVWNNMHMLQITWHIFHKIGNETIHVDQLCPIYSQKELNKSGTDTCLNHILDFVVCTIRKIWKSPAGICQNFLIIWMDETLKSRKCWPHLPIEDPGYKDPKHDGREATRRQKNKLKNHLIKERLWLAPTEVR